MVGSPRHVSLPSHPTCTRWQRGMWMPGWISRRVSGSRHSQGSFAEVGANAPSAQATRLGLAGVPGSSQPRGGVLGAGATLRRWISFLKLCFNFLSFWYQCLCFNELAPLAYQTRLIPGAPCLQFPVAPNQELCCLILPVF